MDLSAHRVSFPAAERQITWLGPLLDAYALMDAAMAASSHAAARRAGKPVACGKGCGDCCIQPIPVTPPEVLGLAWFADVMLQGEARAAVATALAGLREAGHDPVRGPGCPFFVQGVCTVYPLRPLACREYVVLGKPCDLGEDAAFTRPEDMVRLPVAAQRGAFALMLPLAGITGEREIAEALGQGRMLSLARALQSLDWSPLQHRMQERR